MPLFNGDPVVDIYVSQAGNDANDGLSTATPKQTIAAAMTHVDSSREPRLERILSEIRTHRKRVAAAQS